MGDLPHQPVPRLETAFHPLVQEVQRFAEEYLRSIMRSDGLSMAAHGLEVALTLEEARQDPLLTAACLLHDLPAHRQGKALLARSPLDVEGRHLVERMAVLHHLHTDENPAHLERLLHAFAEDPRLLLLRMAHRLNDVRHLRRFPRQQRRAIARETLTMYTAISGRLGFQRWRWQMEDICFLELHPRIARRIRLQFEAFRSTDLACLQHVRTLLVERLRTHGIEATIDERIKGLYSTYRKMVLKDRNFTNLTDRLALRVIVPTVEDCYRALGIIHAHMRPIHGRIKDYIGTPKENGYRSIHTVVYPLPGVSELPIEIQIRTFAMHQECEEGIASHGAYKIWAYALSSPTTRVNLFKNLESLQFSLRTGHSLSEALKRGFRNDRVIVFDPKNTLYHVQRPATALDFACQVFPERCLFIKGARINGREMPLATPLHDGDTVEVLLGEERRPVPELLRACQQEATRSLLRRIHAGSRRKRTREVHLHPYY